MPKTSQALSNLRAFVIIIVLAFHSVLAYLASLPATPYKFDVPPYDWQGFPIVDSERWFDFDLFCAWHDVYLMSLMYFLSGLFVWGSLKRKGSGTYLWDRLMRLGLPLALGLLFLMPLSFYPTYLQTATDPSFAAYWRAFIALPYWPNGQLWFVWELLVLSIAAAGLHWLAPSAGDVLGRWAASIGERPVRFFFVLVVASAVGYVPLALAFSPWDWFQFGPFSFQWCRPLHYAVYFFSGIALGAHGIERGVLAINGALAQRWLMWLAIAFATFCAWIIPMAAIMDIGQPGPLALQFLTDFGFTLACAGGGMFVLAAVLRFATSRTRVLDSLSGNAYGMYLIHYPFVVWLQYCMLNADLPAVVKAAIVFSGTLALSWGAMAVMRALPVGTRLVGPDRRALAKSQDAAI